MKYILNRKENNMAIVMTFKPDSCDDIFSGEKRYEVRKTIPKSRPTKVYVYKSGSGDIVGEFTATKVFKFPGPCVEPEY